jgi:hypothetical protein
MGAVWIGYFGEMVEWRAEELQLAAYSWGERGVHYVFVGRLRSFKMQEKGDFQTIDQI